MKADTKSDNSRRRLITKIIPAAAFACLFNRSIFAMAQSKLPRDEQQSLHKFDKEMEFKTPLTNRQFRTVQNRSYLRFCKGLVNELGNKKALKIIKEVASKEAFAIGQAASIRNGDNSFISFANFFKGTLFKNTITMEIVEDTDTVFEMKVKECLAYEICKAEKCDGELGNFCVCHMDFAMAEGYNSKIKLIRDKTLMQGHDSCNHRYILKA